MVLVEPAPLAWLEALAVSDAEFTAQFGIPVVPGWAGFPEAIPGAVEAARADPDTTWGSHLIRDDDRAVVGFGGWKGPPQEGAAELGYAVAPSRQGSGIATAFVRELVERARAADVALVVAHTLPAESASTTVLRRCGFARVDDVVEADGTVVWRWELDLRPPDGPGELTSPG